MFSVPPSPWKSSGSVNLFTTIVGGFDPEVLLLFYKSPLPLLKSKTTQLRLHEHVVVQFYRSPSTYLHRFLFRSSVPISEYKPPLIVYLS